MEFPEEREERVLAFLESKGLTGCPVCAETEFMSPRRVAALPTSFDAEGLTAINLVPIACTNCGHTMMFDDQTLPS